MTDEDDRRYASYHRSFTVKHQILINKKRGSNYERFIYVSFYTNHYVFVKNQRFFVLNSMLGKT